MSLAALLVLGALAAGPTLFEENAPRITAAWEQWHPQLQYRQPPCSRYTEPPRVVRSGSAITIVHDETPERCFASGDNRSALLGAFPVGVHDVRYEQRRADGTTSSTALTFRVREGSPWRFGFYPPEPLALEALDVEFDYLVCEPPERVEPVTGGFRIVLDRGASNGFDCDAITRTRLRLGAFPPGSYRVALVRTANGRPDEELDAHTVVVTPGPILRETLDGQRPDYSGLWWSPVDAPQTGLDVIHTRDTATTYGDSYTVFWYTYAANGAPAWYVITARRQTFVNRGEVRRFTAATPGALLADRIASSEIVGTAQIHFGSGDEPGEVVATIDGVEQRFRIERFRWQRSGWRY